MGIKRGTCFIPVPALQPDAVLSQANPVSGTKYTVLSAKSNVRLMAISASATWTVQPTPLEIWVTVDGVALRCAGQANPNSAGEYGFYLSTMPMSFDIRATAGEVDKSFILEGRNVKVEAETTGGTVSSLDGSVKYGKW